MSLSRRSLLIGASLLSCGILAGGAAPRECRAQPTLSSVSPGAVRPGQTVELTLSGAKLADPLTLWASFPAQIEILPADAGQAEPAARRCKVTLDPAVPVGLGGLILGNATAATDPFLLLIDDLPSVADSGNNHTRETAQVLTLPLAVDGVSNGVQFDYYKLAAKAGQRLAVEVVAARLGSSFDPVVRLLDAGGQELRFVDDDASLGADCRFAHTFAADGEYVLEVRDNKYAAGGRYRLRAGDFPLVSSAYPLGARLGSTVQLGFVGPEAEEIPSLLLQIPSRVSGGRLPVSAKFASSQSSGWGTVVTSPLPEAVEAEPNEEFAQATRVTIPCAVNGRLQTGGDRDAFTFAAVKGQSVQLRGVSRSVGSPSLPYLRILNSAAATVAETSVGDADEFTLGYTFPADGMYAVLVEDLLQRGGPEHAYRVEIESAPGFTLSLKNDPKTPLKVLAPAGAGGWAAEVQVTRSGYDGPLEIQLEDGGAGFQLHNALIPAKAAAGRVLVAVPPGWKAGDLRQVRLFGKAAAEREERSLVSTQALLRSRVPPLSYPPSWLDGLLTVSGVAEAAPFYHPALASESVFWAQPLGQAHFTVTLERKQAEFKDPITLLVEQLPAGVTAAVTADKDVYQVTLSGPQNLPLGRHALRLVSYGEFQGRGLLLNRELPLEIGMPLTLTVTPAGPLVAGQKQKLKIALVRAGGERQPVTLKWKKLPPGVTGDATITIPADKDELEVELSAAADAAVGSFTELTLEASTTFAGKAVTAESPPATLETKGA